MDGEVLVCVRDGRANFSKECEALAKIQTVLLAVAVDAIALYVLDSEKRLSVLGGPSVEKTRDIRMIERCKNVAFDAKPAKCLNRVEPVTYKFQRDALLEIIALGQVNVSHSAMRDLGDDREVTDPSPGGPSNFISICDDPSTDLKRIIRQEVFVSDLASGSEKAFGLRAKVGIVGAVPVQEPLAFTCRQIDCGFEYLVQASPVARL